MKIIKHPSELPTSCSIVAAIGFFDGVHLGHRWLIDHINNLACSSGESKQTAVITFAQHPRTVLDSSYCPQLIDSLDERLAKLATTGLDYTLLLTFDRELAKLSAQEFLTLLYNQYHVKSLLVGYDHRFGCGRTEGFDDYVRYGEMLGMEVLQTPVYAPDGLHISSSAIRKLLQECRVEEANKLLGSHFSVSGVVVEGYKVGRDIGFPTANLSLPPSHKILLANGCYAVKTIIDGTVYGGMMNIGNRPTLGRENDMSLEVHLFEYSGSLYGATLQLDVVAFLRHERKMANLAELKQQLYKDKEQAIRLLS